MRFFNRITLQTPESVELEFTLAGIGNRALALMIDYTVLTGILLAFWLGWLYFSTQLLALVNTWLNNNANVEQWLLAIALLVSFFVYVGYFVIFEVLWQGQTPGKRFTKIRVIRDDGRPVGPQQGILRALLRPLDDTLFIGFLLIVLSQKEKRLGDWVAGTIVVQQEQAISKSSLSLSPQADSLANQLLDMANVSLLLPDDFAVVREYLQRRKMMSISAKEKLSRQLATQVKAIIELENLPNPMTADLFLEAVYLAYQRQSSNSE